MHFFAHVTGHSRGGGGGVGGRRGALIIVSEPQVLT